MTTFTINDTQKISVYALDTRETIINRIAVSLKSLPKFITTKSLLDSLESVQELNNVVVEDIRSKILKMTDEGNFDLRLFMEKSGMDYVDLTTTDLANLWMIEGGDFARIIVEADPESYKLVKDYIKYGDDIQENILKLRREVENSDKILMELNILKSDIQFTDFVITKTHTILRVKFDGDIMDVFNAIIINQNVPFANIENYYKLYKHFEPSAQWGISLPDAIFLKVAKFRDKDFEKMYRKRSLDELYLDCVIEKQETDLIISFETTLSSEELVLERIRSIFVEFDIIEKTRKEFGGIFYIPLYTINIHVFQDLVMNNKFFANFLGIDESIKATKSKTNIYAYYSEPGINITLSLTEKMASTADQEIRDKDRQIFPYEQSYIRIFITHTKSEKDVERFRKVFMQLLSIYKEEFDNVVKFYKKFIPVFPPSIKQKPLLKKDQTKLKYLNPDLFVLGYSRKCYYQPSLIEDIDHVEYMKKMGYDVIHFPKTLEEGPQYYYACDGNEEYRFPGLIKNTLRNSDKYKFLPCCYKDDQSIKRSNYTSYYSPEIVYEDSTKFSQHIISTNKFAQYDAFGELPKKLEEFFNIVDPSNKYFRKGSHDTAHSFLECVSEAKQSDIEFDENYFENYRGELNINFSVARQEMYDKTPEQIEAIFRDPKEYLDPLNFIRVLEIALKVDIYLFSRNDENPDGMMILPNFMQNYYSYKSTNKKSVLIYVHTGSERVNFPKSELIIRQSPNKTVADYIFNNDSDIMQKIRWAHDMLSLQYSLQKRVEKIDKISDMEIIGQGIDAYGKTRLLKIRLINDSEVNVFIDPIPPLNIPELSHDKFLAPTTIQNAMKIITIETQILDNQHVVELVGRLENIRAVIPINNEAIMKGIPGSYKRLYVNDEMSVFTLYNRNRRYAHYITEYTYWMFAHYVKNTVTDEDIREFIENKVVLDLEHQYENIGRRFSEDSTFIRNDKLIVTSEELRKRLKYILKLKSIRDLEDLLDYTNKKEITNYYMDPSDFTSHPHQVILKGTDAFLNWIDERRSQRFVYDQIQPELDGPYFFGNQLITGGKIYLAQNVEIIDDAIEIADTWNLNGYNKKEVEGIEIMENMEKTFTFYSYVSNDNIKKYIVNGDIIATKNKICIIGYKVFIEDEEEILPRYTVLLDL